MKFIIRDETRATERRTAVTPKDAKTLLNAGFEISVERSDKRIFINSEYAAVGCELANAGAWLTVTDATVLGLKELPEEPADLKAPFIHFAHIFKDQTGWESEIKRFRRGGGRLYDIEYLTKEERRIAAFGYWAGWMGAALAAWRLLARWNGVAGPEVGVSSFETRGEVEDILRKLSSTCMKPRRAVVIGAKGRSGSGAIKALKLAGFEVTEWDMAETRNLDKPALMAHDLLVNCVLMTGPGLQLLMVDDISNPLNFIQMISDVSCDPFSNFNPLPIYNAPTGWDAPFVSLGKNGIREEIELTAIDNLPSLLPREASEVFSSQMVKSLLTYPHGEEWLNAAQTFDDALNRAGLT
ncbi:MAG: saccharopine dehydrogenase [Paracoccaceae bacterium]